MPVLRSRIFQTHKCQFFSYSPLALTAGIVVGLLAWRYPRMASLDPAVDRRRAQGRRSGRGTSWAAGGRTCPARPCGGDGTGADARSRVRDRRRRPARSARVPDAHECAPPRDRPGASRGWGVPACVDRSRRTSSTASRNSAASTRRRAVRRSSRWRRRSGSETRWVVAFIVAVMAGEEVLVLDREGSGRSGRPAFNPVAATLGPSFPSGHSATAAAFYATAVLLIGRRRRDRARAALSGWPQG